MSTASALEGRSCINALIPQSWNVITMIAAIVNVIPMLYQYCINDNTMIVNVIPMQRFAKTGRPVEARHSRAHSHSSTFRKYYKIEREIFCCSKYLKRRQEDVFESVNESEWMLGTKEPIYTSRVPQLTCIWMSLPGASRLGNPIR